MNEIEKLFEDLAIIKGGIMLFSKNDALSFIKSCRIRKISILGIDAFYLIGDGIQPSLENSIDFSSSEYIQTEDIYSEAINFLREKNEKLFFEIVCID